VTRVDVVPHTHWDREWYSPYPTFRLRLVDLIDELLPRLEADPDFGHFQLDGQMAVVDDYLGLRPDAAERIRALAADGRLSMGPWYVLPDEFLVSGETHVRNLQLGMRRAADFGGAMEVGYLPDMFGHIAQMPQILTQFGFDDAVVWRGVPSSVTGPAFWWIAPDGSRIRATYLPAGYGNGSGLPADPDGVRDQIELFRTLQGDLVGDPVLVMAGMDHEVPPAHLSTVVAELNAAEADRAAGETYHLRIRSLADHLADTARDHLGEIHGEMRSGYRANVLMGVASNRVDVKQSAARAERLLERVAEPLAALWMGDEHARWQPVLDLAWLDVIRNAAHDSICACSHDEVVDAVRHRYAESIRLARGVADRAVTAGALGPGTPGPVVLNATARTRTGMVEIDVAGVEPTGDATSTVQVLVDRPEVEEIEGAVGADAPMRLAMASMAEHPDTRKVHLDRSVPGVLTAHLLARRSRAERDLDPDPEPVGPAEELLSPADALATVGALVAEQPDLELRLVVHRSTPSRRVLTLAGDVPGFGWALWSPVVARHPVRPHGELGLTNGLVAVEADPATGTFALDGVAGFGRLVDDGDAGDTYNWCPPEHDVVIDRPESVVVTVAEAGPIRGRLVIRSTYVLPERCAIDGRDDMVTGWSGGESYRRVGEVTQVVTTTVEVRADDPAVRVTTAWDQRARDHRLRVHLPLPTPATHSEAEDAYAVVRRPLWAEGGPNEWGVPTFPSRRFVRAGGLTVTHEGLCEYELVDLLTPDGRTLPDTTGLAAADAASLGTEPPEGTTASAVALTLVRSTGWLSRGPMPSRPQPAGPFDRLEGSQTLRPLELRYAIQLDTTAGALEPYALADHVWNPLLSAVAPGGGDLGDRGTHLEVQAVPAGAVEIDAVLRDDHGRLVVRAHAVGDRAGTLTLPGRSGAVIDLLGREVDTFAGSIEVDPHRIVTLRLER